jgi:hypothetical protein
MDRTWHIGANDSGYGDRQAMLGLLSELEPSLFHLGGMLAVAAVREPVDGDYRTVGYVMSWQSFAPAQRSTDVSEPELVVADGD